MSWRDNLRPASFRGVAFEVSEHTVDLGRRFAVHEFPLRDAAEIEDMGKLARAYSVEAFVIGPNYDVDRDALIEALEAPGTGVLIHPWLGQHTVALMRGSFAESTAEGGMARFRLEFVEPSPAKLATRTIDTAGLASDAADALDEAAQASFADRFGITGWADFVQAGAADVLGAATDFVTNARETLTGFGAPLNAFIAQGKSLKAQILTLARAPTDLALALSGLILGLREVASTPSEALGVLRTVMSFGDSLKPVVGVTAARRQQATNQAAVVDLIRHVAAAEAVQAISRISFASYPDAIATRDLLADSLDVLAETAAAAGNDTVFHALEDARFAVVRDVTARGANLARIYQYQLRQTEPALVIAHRLYADLSELEAREAEIIARNGIIHPLFVSPRRPLEVLSDV